MSFRIDRGQIIPANKDIKKSGGSNAKNNADFQSLLQETITRQSDIKVSAHAQQRMQERNITLEQSDLDALKGAIDELEQKGARESLMLYKDYAFIASVRNRTIITSMDSSEVDVVTNIDSAIIVR
ncbi:MAG: TIGR02530 family flagellar biosynthesis protein [Gudongella sp.]|nr:TIGR02530 family flagellar biosynthesis protein [Gudongella sp.]